MKRGPRQKVTQHDPQRTLVEAPCAAAAGFGCVGRTADRLEAGRRRIAEADAAAAKVVARATPPATVNLNIHASPARGPMRALRQVEMVTTPSGPRPRPATRDGFHAAIKADAFDLMERQARRRRPGGDPLYTVAQVGAGRAYAALAERVAAEGIRCGSFEPRIRGADEGRDWIDGVLARSARLARMRDAIGEAPVLVPRGAEAHADRGRRPIMLRALVDHVCCEEQTLSGVLRRHGWSAKTSSIATAREALIGALDRLWGL